MLVSRTMANIDKCRRRRMQAYRVSLESALARTRKVSWQVACPQVACPLTTPHIAIAFWHASDGAPKQLPHAVTEGLASCARNSGLTVYLLSYQCTDVIAGGVPPGVHVRDANRVLQWPVFARLMLQHRIQHVSDYVRALALVHGIDGSGAGGGWLVDADTIWLRRAPMLSVVCPPHLGH